MQPVTPFWFNMRQGKASAVNESTLALTAPNLPESFVGVRKGENGRWSAILKKSADGPEVAASSPIYDRESEAWNAAFELFRTHLVV